MSTPDGIGSDGAKRLSDEHPRYSPDGAHLAWHSYNLKRAFNDQGRLTLLDRRSAARDDSRRASIARRPATAGLRMARRSNFLIEDRAGRSFFDWAR